MRGLIASAVRYEWRRLTSHRRFFFWALIGVPFLLPVALGAVTLLLAVSLLGPPKPAPTGDGASIVLLDQWSPAVAPSLAAAGVRTVPPPRPEGGAEALDAELRAAHLAVALIARRDPAGEQTLIVRLAPTESRAPSRLLDQVQQALDAYHRERLERALDPLAMAPDDRSALITPPALALQSLAPPADPSLLILVVIAWSGLIVMPYMQLARSGSASIVNDRLGGLLVGVCSGLLSARAWVFTRWAVLALLGTLLVLYYGALLALFMWAYGAVADRLLSGGILESLAAANIDQARFALIELVAAWRALSFIEVLPVFLLGFVQAGTLASLLLLGSTLAASVPASRLYELLPFALAFILPFLALGGIGEATLGPPVLLTGLNSLMAMAALLRDGLAATSLYVLVLVSNLAWLVLALEWAARRSASEAFLAPSSG